MKRYEYNYGKNPEGALSTISGYATETTNFGETAFGILNKSTRDEENFTTPEVVSSSTATLFSVGNGTDNDSRKNIIELKADGTVYINGVGQYDGTNPGESTSIADEFQGIHDDITGLNEDVDRIDNTIESIHISEDNTNLIYTLLVDGQERGTINIPRDQFLKNVSYNEETNNLEFTFIVRGENNEEVEKQVNVNMTDLEDIYSAGDGLNLENKQFSVKVDADTQPYIEVSSNGVKIIGINEALDKKVSWDESKKVITLPADGSISALRNNGLEGGVLICQRTYDDGATYVTEVGTTKNNLTLNSIERPKIDFADGTSQNVAYESEIKSLQDRMSTAETDIDNLEGRMDAAESDIDTIQSDLGELTGDGEGSVQDQIKTALEDYLPLSGGTMAGNIEFSGSTTMGIIIQGKSNTDLVNAAGGTTSIDDITSQIDLTPYATKEEVGSNTYTGANYISKETNLTDAVIQLDEEIKATNDNLALEHANAEATYAKKTDLSGYLPLTGGNVTGKIFSADSIEIGRNFITGTLQPPHTRISFSGFSNYVDPEDSDTDAVYITGDRIDNWNNWGGVSPGMTIHTTNGITRYYADGVTIPNKTASDLLNAVRGTVSIQDIISQVTVPTKVSELTNDSGYQTEAQVAAKVASLVDSAPETLDTLNELAAALGDDPNFATTVTNQIASKQDKLVSGTNIKTINGQTLLGSGDIDLSSYVTTDNLSGYLKVPTTEETGSASIDNYMPIIGSLNNNNTFTGGLYFNPNTSSLKVANTADQLNDYVSISNSGINIAGKTNNDLVAAGGGTVNVNTLATQDDLENYVTLYTQQDIIGGLKKIVTTNAAVDNPDTLLQLQYRYTRSDTGKYNYKDAFTFKTNGYQQSLLEIYVGSSPSDVCPKGVKIGLANAFDEIYTHLNHDSLRVHNHNDYKNQEAILDVDGLDVSYKHSGSTPPVIRRAKIGTEGIYLEGMDTYITISGKTSQDLLHAAGGTTTLKTIGGETILGSGNFDIATESDITALFN